MAKYKVVIVGGGFGGTKAALILARNPLIDVTLIHDHPDFRYYPTLFRTATGGRKMVSSIPIEEVFSRLPINLVEESLIDIDEKQQLAETDKGTLFHYDALILALGVKTNYFNIKGLEEYSYGIKTVEDAIKLKSHLHEQLTNDQKPDLNYVVVGGGPTGIELAGMLPSYLKKIIKNHGMGKRKIHIDLVEAAPRLLPRSPKIISMAVTRQLKRLGVKLYLGTTIQAETADELIMNNNLIKSHTVILTAGVTNNSFFAQHDFQLSTNGKVRVDQYLQAKPGIYVIGDNADTPYSGMAQTAIYDGMFIANNLQKMANKQDPSPYMAKKPIYVFAAGPHWSAVLWGNLKLFGRLGNGLRRMSDLVGFHDYEPWRLAAKLFMAESQNEESCPQCSKKKKN